VITANTGSGPLVPSMISTSLGSGLRDLLKVNFWSAPRLIAMMTRSSAAAASGPLPANAFFFFPKLVPQA